MTSLKVLNIGNGAFGQVWFCSKENVAKKITSMKADDITNLISFIREVHVLSLKNDYIVKFTEIKYRYNSVEVHMERMNMDLQKLIRSRVLEPKEIQTMTLDISRGLHFLHSNQIAHRDMKPSNILIKNGRAKLCDFGLSRRFCNELSRGSDYMVTRWYRAPEIIDRKQPYKFGVDLWALGCIVYEMVTRRALFPLASDAQLEEAYKRRDEKIQRVTDKMLFEIVDNTVKYDPKIRWDAGKCIYYLSTEPAKNHVMDSTKDYPINNVEINKWFTKMLKDFPGNKRAIMFGLSLFPDTSMTEKDFRYSLIVGYLLLETYDMESPFLRALIEDEALNAKKIARWMCGGEKYFDKVSSFEIHGKVEQTMDAVFKKKRKICEV